jgi:hypothetical protein
MTTLQALRYYGEILRAARHLEVRRLLDVGELDRDIARLQAEDLHHALEGKR